METADITGSTAEVGADGESQQGEGSGERESCPRPEAGQGEGSIRNQRPAYQFTADQAQARKHLQEAAYNV